MKKINKSEKAAVIKVIAFYLIICLLLFTALSLAFYALTRQLISSEEKNARKRLENEVQAVYTSMENQIKRANKVCYSLIQNENFNYIINNPSGTQVTNAMNKLGKQINIECVSDEFIEDIVIYFNSGDGIHVGKNGQEDKIFGENLNFWEKYFNGEQYTGGKIECTGAGELCFVQTYPVTWREEGVRSTFIIKLRKNMFANLSVDSDVQIGNESVLSVVDLKTNKIAVNGEWTELPKVGTAFFNNNQGYEIFGENLIAYRQSGQIPIAYAAVEPAAALNAAIQKIVILSAGLLIVCIILCFILIGLGIWRSYNPLRQLLALVNSDSGRKGLFAGSYSEIRSVILEAMEQKMAYENLYKEKNSLEKRQLFCAMLESKKSSEEVVQKSAHDIGVYPEKGFNCFVYMCFIDITAYFSEHDGKDSDELPMRFCEAFLIKLLEENYKVVSIPYQDRIIFCLSTEENNAESNSRVLKNSLKQIQNLLRERYAIDTLTAVSNYHVGVKGLKNGFVEVSRIIKHLKFMGNRSLTVDDSVASPGYDNSIYVHPVKEEAYLENYIKSGDMIKAKETFLHIMKDYYNNSEFSPQVYKLRLYALLGRILDSVSYTQMTKTNKTADEVDMYVDLIEFDNIDEFCNKINGLLDKVEAFNKSEEKDLEKDFVKNVKKIIVTHYMDYNLNVTSIAEALNKNLDFVSRTFKKNTGEGLLDYIQKIRIDKAKQFFMEDEALSVQQVANMVGYVSCESFIRVFKSKEGTTPGRYKSSIKK